MYCKMRKVFTGDMNRVAIAIMTFRKPDGTVYTDFDLRDYLDRLFIFEEFDTDNIYAVVGCKRVKRPYPHALHDDIDQIYYTVDFAFLDAEGIKQAGYDPVTVLSSMFFEMNALSSDYPIIIDVDKMLQESIFDGSEEREALVKAVKSNDYKYMNSDMISELYWRVVPFSHLSMMRESLV